MMSKAKDKTFISDKIIFSQIVLSLFALFFIAMPLTYLFLARTLVSVLVLIGVILIISYLLYKHLFLVEVYKTQNKIIISNIFGKTQIDAGMVECVGVMDGKVFSSPPYFMLLLKNGKQYIFSCLHLKSKTTHLSAQELAQRIENRITNS
jgi:hypothetical protein